jgi:hypothetical protein
MLWQILSIASTMGLPVVAFPIVVMVVVDFVVFV